jgi:hypothetical protein
MVRNRWSREESSGCASSTFHQPERVNKYACHSHLHALKGAYPHFSISRLLIAAGARLNVMFLVGSRLCCAHHRSLLG